MHLEADGHAPQLGHTDVTRALALAAVLCCFDLALILLDLLRHDGVLQDARFAVTTERGYGEWFQYLKAAALVTLLVGLRRRARTALVWAGLFLFVLIDDAVALHESLGLLVARALDLPSFGPARPEHVGELLVYAIAGFAFLALLAVRSGEPRARRLSLVLALPFALLAFFGTIVDFLHSLSRGYAFSYAAGLVEDGGELLAMSVLLAVVFWEWRRQ